jgi:hypothetical protein
VHFIVSLWTHVAEMWREPPNFCRIGSEFNPERLVIPEWGHRQIEWRKGETSTKMKTLLGNWRSQSSNRTASQL